VKWKQELNCSEWETYTEQLQCHCGNLISPMQLREVYPNVVEALKKIHSKGVLHGDSALNNNLINSAGSKITLIDFGLANFYGSQQEGSAGLSYV
jgi:serine/threonine protein kinase